MIFSRLSACPIVQLMLFSVSLVEEFLLKFMLSWWVRIRFLFSDPVIILGLEGAGCFLALRLSFCAHASSSIALWSSDLPLSTLVKFAQLLPPQWTVKS